MSSPEVLIAVEPLHGVFHRGGLERAAHGASRLASRDEAGIAQHVEVLHDGRQRHRERPRQFADGKPVGVVQPGQQGTPSGVRKRGKRAVQSGILILNHIVKYRHAPTAVNRYLKNYEFNGAASAR